MIVIGAGGHAKEVADEWVKGGKSLGDLEFFDSVTGISEFLGRPVRDNPNFWTEPQSFILGIGAPSVRKALCAMFVNAGHKECSIIANSAQVSSLSVSLGEGINIMANVVVGPCVRIGDGVLLNSGSHVHHDVVIGDFCEISPRVSILGGAIVGDGARVGSGAIIFPGVKVGAGAVIGGAALVNRDVCEGSTVFGIPARKIKR